ncbi:protein TIFY 6B-like [Carica papaya]|uniref:protein TIFY 6B-like n=1 Tax=Carica papaya TaxID=3649 RepID=UPI000B8CA627|nr:protein TIFY 6B-like [Carica papaya]
MPLKVTQDDKTKKIGNDPLLSSVFMPTSEIQHDVHSLHRQYEMKMFPVANQAVSVPMSSGFFQNHFATCGQNLPAATMKSQLLGGIPVATAHSVLPAVGCVGGMAEPWNDVKMTGSPAQLTIFYAGTVNVFQDISPEKAQAIMFMAGTGSSMMTHPKVHVPAPSSKPAAGDGSPVNQPISTPPSSGLSSPLSVSSHTGAQSGSGSTSTEDMMAAKTVGIATAPVSKVEPPKMVNAVGSVSATSMIPSVPQARKASLARFLEKRKERVMNSAPYNLHKKSAECTDAESNGMNYSASSAAGTGCF